MISDLSGVESPSAATLLSLPRTRRGSCDPAEWTASHRADMYLFARIVKSIYSAFFFSFRFVVGKPRHRAHTGSHTALVSSPSLAVLHLPTYIRVAPPGGAGNPVPERFLLGLAPKKPAPLAPARATGPPEPTTSEEKLDVLTFWPLSETRDRTHPYTGEMGLRLALACPDCTG